MKLTLKQAIIVTSTTLIFSATGIFLLLRALYDEPNSVFIKVYGTSVVSILAFLAVSRFIEMLDDPPSDDPPE